MNRKALIILSIVLAVGAIVGATLLIQRHYAQPPEVARIEAIRDAMHKAFPGLPTTPEQRAAWNAKMKAANAKLAADMEESKRRQAKLDQMDKELHDKLAAALKAKSAQYAADAAPSTQP